MKIGLIHNLRNLQNAKSLITAFILIIVLLISHFNIPKYKIEGFTQELTYDVTSYYLYLPMSFIYDDSGMRTDKVDSLFKKYNFSPTLYQVHKTDINSRVPNYTIGMSYAYAPFFFIAHVWAKSSNFEADGFSFPYQFMISTGFYLFLIAGIFLLRRFLLYYFSDTVCTLTLIILVLGTNFFSEAVSNILQPHIVLFALYTALLVATHLWHKKPSLAFAGIIGFLIGWIFIIRPTDIVSVLIPLLYGIKDKVTFYEKLDKVKANITHVLIATFFLVLTFIPQFIYWFKNTGQFFYYSYKRTEGFDFLEPHFFEALFSFKKSLFIYTPMLIFAVIGFYFIFKQRRNHFLYVTVFTLLNFFLLSSWTVWWGGASFGMRYFVQSYAILSIPFAAFIENLIRYRFKVIPVWLIIAFFIFLNVFQTWQFVNWILPEDRMNFAYYKASFLKTSVTDEDMSLMEEWRNNGYTESFTNEDKYQHYTVAYYNFEDLNSGPVDDNVITKEVSKSPPYACELSAANPYYPTYRIRYDRLVKKKLDHVWLRVSLYYYSEYDFEDNKASLVVNVQHNSYNHKYRAYDLKSNPHKKNEWNYFSIDYMTPYPYSKKDSIEFYVWYRDDKKLYVDDFKVEVFEKIEQLNR